MYVYFYLLSFQVKKGNTLKDFVSVAGPLNVSHFVVFTKTDLANYMRLIRLPRGPTVTFKINEYSLSRDIVTSLRKPNMESQQFHHHPLLVMNSFSKEDRNLSLLATMFQNMFPSINVNKVWGYKGHSQRQTLQTLEQWMDQWNITAILSSFLISCYQHFHNAVPNIWKIYLQEVITMQCTMVKWTRNSKSSFPFVYLYDALT